MGRDYKLYSITVFSAAAAMLSVLILTKNSPILESSWGRIVLLALILGSIVVTLLAYFYLDRVAIALADRDESYDSVDDSEFSNLEVEALQNRVETLESLVTKIDESAVTKLAVRVREEVLEEASTELIKDLKDKVNNESLVRQLRVQVRNQFEKSEVRLIEEVKMLRGRSNVNMGIGIIIALVGASGLAYSLLYASREYRDFPDLAMHIIPRFSVVLLIELFAYFFLRMYRSSLDEIRYFQNEITNIEMKKVSALLAVSTGATEELLKDFSATDRNVFLRSDQSTQELEKLRIETQAFKSSLNTLSSFFAKTTK